MRAPRRRAAYLCELAGASINAHSNTAMPAAFLLPQMQWREALEEAADSESLEALADRVARSRREALASCGEAIDTACDFPLAVEQVRSLMFIERFAAELDARIDAVQDAAGAWGRGQ